MKARRWPLRPADGKRALLHLALSLLLALVVLRGLVPGIAQAGAARSPGVGQPAVTGTATAGGKPAAGWPAAVGTPTRPLPASSEALASRSPWSRPESYPLALKPRADLYRPSASWIGRLILPTAEDLAAPLAPNEDWVWIEIEQAPAERQALIGQRLRLRWADRPELRRLVQTVTTTIRLGEAARQAAAEANVVPTRLDGRRVGPLQSLAGARPRDDVTVALESVSFNQVSSQAARSQAVRPQSLSSQPASSRGASPLLASSQGTPAPGTPASAETSPVVGELRIASPPLQITGRWQGLVTIVGRAPGDDLWRVRHYNPASAGHIGAVFRGAGLHGAGFDGVEETIRIPSLPLDRFGYRLIDPGGLAASPYNAEGWLIQGSPAADGVFTVQALLPYALLDLSSNRVVAGTNPALAYLRHDSWRHPLRRGSLSHTALIPDREPPPAWALGERALLMHLFGGIGGEDAEVVVPPWTVTGHFAFGEAEVVRDRFTGRPRLAIRYHQIYASNPNGIIAGSQDWSAYAGNLQRGWIGLRPFSDLLIPMGAEVLDAIDLQAELMAARYRSGDGNGIALVTPSTSCVQDSAQALWIAIQQLRRERLGEQSRDAGSAGSPAAGTVGGQVGSPRGGPAANTVGGAQHDTAGGTAASPAGRPEGEPMAMSAQDRERLHELGLAFDHLLEPFGRVRGDWKRNAASSLAAGTGSGSGATAVRPAGTDPFQASQSLQDALLSWRSLVPRSAHDLFAAEFLRVGLPLLELRTNQIPGADPRLEPIAPTALFGQLPGVSLLFGRLGDSLFPLWQPGGHLAALAVALVYGVLALGLGRRSGWFRRPMRWSPLRRLIPHALGLFVVPAFLEELLFRGLLLPSLLDGVTPLAMLPWMALSVGLFVLWQELKTRIAPGRRRRPRPVHAGLAQPSAPHKAPPPRALGPAALLQFSLLGTACSLVVVVSGSLWPAVLLHGLAVVAWREGVGGGMDFCRGQS